MTRRGSCSMTGGEDYDLASHFDKGSCEEEDEYHPIPKNEEEEEAPDLEYEYAIPTIPRTSPEVRSRNSSPSRFVNTSNTNCGNSRQGSIAREMLYPEVPRTNIMVGNDIKLPIFNSTQNNIGFYVKSNGPCYRSRMKQ